MDARKLVTRHLEQRDRRPGSGLLRTLVVASATLAILLVCFSIYQYSQLDPKAAARIDGARQPGIDSDFPPAELAQGNAGFDAGSAKVGQGERIQLTFYPREGNRARVELSVTSCTPVAGETSQFILSSPEIRLHTKAGNAVRVTAERGRLEAPRKPGRGLDLKRGELTGGVVLLLDRLTEEERGRLPPAARDAVDPADLVRVETDEIDFDLEYSKLIVPGPWRLTARDVSMTAADLEMRFNEAENRVDFVRIDHGGRIELLEQSGQLGLSLPALDAGADRQTGLVDWLRASLESRLAAKQRESRPPESAAAPAVTFTDDGVPIFNMDAKESKRLGPPERYYARFDGQVEATQRAADAGGSRLSADVLEIVREFTDRSRPVSEPSAGGAEGTASAEAPSPTQATVEPRVVLTWNDRLLVEPCRADHVACQTTARARIRAEGRPVRIASADGDAKCASMTFDPDGSKLTLRGAEGEPVAVNLGTQGTLTGLEVRTERTGDAFELHVAGPGRLTQNADGPGPTVTGEADGRPVSSRATATTNGEPADIEFAERLDATGRNLRHTAIGLTGRISTGKRAVLDTAAFHGAVRLRQGDSTLGADAMTANFAKNHRVHDRQPLERIVAAGHATMSQGDDRLSCREIDIILTTDASGKTAPCTAVASGDVSAQQGERTIQARDRLVVDFGMLDRPTEPVGPSAPAAERRPGSDVTTGSIPGSSLGGQHQSPPGRQVVAERLRAFGEVSVVDPTQGLEVASNELDCTIGDGRGIDSVEVHGTPDRPATVRLDTLTVTGPLIRVNVPDQWASVPSAGRLTFLSHKDLDGRRLAQPMPIAVTWQESMTYRGRENRAEFRDRVHATSSTTTTFDCDHLFVEFTDAAPKPRTIAPQDLFSLMRLAMERVSRTGAANGRLVEKRSKEPTYILASGNAVARTETLDPATGTLRTRVHIEGPKISVNLRPDVSKAQIEGQGTLLIEDYRAGTGPEGGVAATGGLFAVDERSGPSNTLIEWTRLMWYDFGIEQTRFEGDVQLKYFSGAELLRVRGGAVPPASAADRGRATFLTSDVLTVDFLDRAAETGITPDRRLGRLSAGQLRQFQASGNVVLRDESEGLSLTAERVVFWKDSNLLGIFGTPNRKAVIITQKPGQLPNQAAVEHVYYSLTTGLKEVSQAEAKGR